MMKFFTLVTNLSAANQSMLDETCRIRMDERVFVEELIKRIRSGEKKEEMKVFSENVIGKGTETMLYLAKDIPNVSDYCLYNVSIIVLE